MPVVNRKTKPKALSTSRRLRKKGFYTVVKKKKAGWGVYYWEPRYLYEKGPSLAPIGISAKKKR